MPRFFPTITMSLRRSCLYHILRFIFLHLHICKKEKKKDKTIKRKHSSLSDKVSQWFDSSSYQSFMVKCQGHKFSFHFFQISDDPCRDLCFSQQILPILHPPLTTTAQTLTSMSQPRFCQSKSIFWTESTVADKARQNSHQGTRMHAYHMHIHTKAPRSNVAVETWLELCVKGLADLHAGQTKCLP